MQRKWVGNSFWNSCVEFVQVKFNANAKQHYSENKSWNEKVKDQAPSWYPINSTSFNKQNVRLMINSFFHKGLQKKLLEKYNKDNKNENIKLVEADENDVECQNEIKDEN